MNDIVEDDFARYETRVALTDGVFLPRKRGERKALQIATEGDGVRLTWRMFHALGPDDESVLLALISILGEDSMELVATPGTRLRKLLDPDDTSKAPSRATHTSLYEVAKRAGFTYPGSGSAQKAVKQSLTRLSSTILRVETEEFEGCMALCAFMMEKKTGKLAIASHCRLAQALIGDKTFARVSLTERTQLDSDAAKVAHRWLSAWLPGGQTRRIGLDRLVSHVWGGEEITSSGLRDRRATLRSALAEITVLPGWTASITGQGAEAMATISRPPFPKADTGVTATPYRRNSDAIPA